MAKTTKPTKQQIAQAKARAGGNNPVKVTNADLKKLAEGALIAASFTPVGRAAKVAGKTASKVIGNVINKKTRTNYLDGLYYTSGLEPGIKAARNARKVANSFEKPIKAKAKANARGLKAANKPTNKVGSKADKEIRSRTKSVTLGKEETATLNDYYYGMPDMIQVMSRRTPVNEARSVRALRTPVKQNNAISTSKNTIKRKTEPKKFQNIRNEVRQEARANRTRSGKPTKNK